MTHTPGPWKKDGLKVIAGTRGTICVCPVVSLGGTFDVEANARLIAAAPELVGALKEIAKGEGPYSRNKLNHAENTITHMMLVAEQALALVEGGE